MSRLVHVITSAASAGFFRGQLAYMREAGFDVTLVSAPGPELELVASREGVRAVALPMRREPAPCRDLLALVRLTRLLRRIRPEIVHVHTPKAALLGALAARIAGVPVRIYSLWGLRAEGLTGLGRRMLLAAERLTCGSVHRIVCESESLRRLVVKLRLAPAEKLVVLGAGSANGIDSDRFSRSPQVLARAGELRAKLRIPEGAPVVGFVGRIVRDKGLVELVDAFRSLGGEFPELRLLLVGSFEEYDPVPAKVRREIEAGLRIAWSGYLDDPAPAYALMDVLVHPSRREGFAFPPLEAALMGIPAVTTNATGCVDSVIDGATGAIVPVRDPVALGRALAAYLRDPELRLRHGRAGRERVLRDFRPEAIWRALLDEYVALLTAKGLPLPGKVNP
jgi:glycosyltransferase involved in cell wall biosynthesis